MTKQRNEKPNDKVEPRSKQTKEIEETKKRKRGTKNILTCSLQRSQHQKLKNI